MKLLNIVIDNNTRYTDAFFTYGCPSELEEKVHIGSRVKVPFNRGNSEKTGYVFSMPDTIDFDESRLKYIIDVDENVSLTEEIVNTCLWMKVRYGIKYIDAVRCFVPPGKATKEGKEKRPLKEEDSDTQIIEALTPEQEKARKEIVSAIKKQKQTNFLIHGVTGSGKTEIYMQAIQETIEIGKSAIMLVPEIALTKQILERLIGRFGRENLAILHSKLTQRERFDEWTRIRRGEAKIVVGARMAVFAPLENIGLIVMDEEHEQTYKSDKNPKYETVDIALKRVMYYKGVLVLGSATPSVVSYERAQAGIYKLIELKERYNGVQLPEIDIVDMREELRQGNKYMFSSALYEAISETLENKEQVILFLNRRGYSNFVSCRECGEAVRCKECGISMTYHKGRNALVCHYCGKTIPVPKECPECGSTKIKYFGVGTEQVEEFTKEKFPNAKVARLDLDTAKNRREINAIINDFKKGTTDILIGTQLVAKGLDFKNVGLVGVIAADMSLNIPDYRSGERTFQLITQVAGRAGRGDKKGRVIVQTYSPDSIPIMAASKYDYKGYFNSEADFRKVMGYPPYSDLILVEFTHKDERVAEKVADEFYSFITEKAVVDSGDAVFSPRISKHFKGTSGDASRFYVLIKCLRDEKTGKRRLTKRNSYLAAITLFIERYINNKGEASIQVDVNPYSTI